MNEETRDNAWAKCSERGTEGRERKYSGSSGETVGEEKAALAGDEGEGSRMGENNHGIKLETATEWSMKGEEARKSRRMVSRKG